ncbi:MAG: cell division protein FtsL [Halanaerobiales bacterium]|nr:cell division protein FtsL [Halanaerobiales bacterium]
MYKNNKNNYNNNVNGYSNYKSNEYNEYDEDGKKNIYIYLILLTICAILLLVYISYTLQINNLSYKIDQMQNELHTLEEKNHKLNIKLSNASSLSQVDQLARNELNMVEPESMETIVLKSKEVEVAEKPENSYFLSEITNFIVNLGTARAYSPE